MSKSEATFHMPRARYNALLGAEKDDIGLGNRDFWELNDK
jgi:hypothetical protein